MGGWQVMQYPAAASYYCVFGYMARVNVDKVQLTRRFFTRGRYYSMHDYVLSSQGRAAQDSLHLEDSTLGT